MAHHKNWNAYTMHAHSKILECRNISKVYSKTSHFPISSKSRKKFMIMESCYVDNRHIYTERIRWKAIILVGCGSNKMPQFSYYKMSRSQDHARELPTISDKRYVIMIAPYLWKKSQNLEFGQKSG